MRRYELTDRRWEPIADLFPPNGGRGKRGADHRRLLDGMSRHCAPVCRIQKMPSIVVGGSFYCPSRRPFAGIRPVISAHCPSVSSYRRTLRPPVPETPK